MPFDDDDALLASQVGAALRGLSIASGDGRDEQHLHSRVAELSEGSAVLSLLTGSRQRKSGESAASVEEDAAFDAA